MRAFFTSDGTVRLYNKWYNNQNDLFDMSMRTNHYILVCTAGFTSIILIITIIIWFCWYVSLLLKDNIYFTLINRYHNNALHFFDSYRHGEVSSILDPKSKESKEVQTTLISDNRRVRFSVGVQTPFQSYSDNKVNHT